MRRVIASGVEIGKNSISRNHCAETAMMNGHFIRTPIMRKIVAINAEGIGAQPSTDRYAPAVGANLGKGGWD